MELVKYNKLEDEINVIKQNPLSIQFIYRPKEKTKLEAVRLNPMTIKYIERPSNEVQIAAVRRECCVIKYIDNPCREAQVIAVEGDWYLISSIKYPHKDAQLAAVKQNLEIFNCINNPDESVVKYYIENQNDIERVKMDKKVYYYRLEVKSHGGKYTLSDRIRNIMPGADYSGTDIGIIFIFMIIILIPFIIWALCSL